MNANRDRAGRRGFTLIELMVVIVIIIIMAGLTLGMMGVFLRDQGIRAAGSLVMQTISLCRQRAAETRVMHFVVFDENTAEECGVMRTYKDVNGTKHFEAAADVEVEGPSVMLPRGATFKVAPKWIGIEPSGYCSGYTDVPSSQFEKRMKADEEGGDIIINMRGSQKRVWCIDIDPAAGKVRRGVLLTGEKE
jgi:prepilin-type N-terminal cleavage/methylation domain-containing protein